MADDVVIKTGPLFEPGLAETAVRRMTSDWERESAERGAEMVRQNLHAVLRHPTGHYVSKVMAHRTGGAWAVWDSNVIYGPWLEGVGSRNARTRFKGYATFRKATQALQHEAEALADAKAARVVGELS